MLEYGDTSQIDRQPKPWNPCAEADDAAATQPSIEQEQASAAMEYDEFALPVGEVIEEPQAANAEETSLGTNDQGQASPNTPESPQDQSPPLTTGGGGNRLPPGDTTLPPADDYGEGGEEGESTAEHVHPSDVHETLNQALLGTGEALGDGFYWFGTIDREEVRVSSYQTTLGASHTNNASCIEEHEALLSENKAIISVEFTCEPDETDAHDNPVRLYSYVSAVPRELSLDHHFIQLAALFEVTPDHLLDAMEQTYATTGQPLTIDDLPGLFNKEGVSLSDPTVFVGTHLEGTSYTELLTEQPDHDTHHRRLHKLQEQLTAAEREPDF
ncbi:MAG TPA: hypothetical protein VLF60_00995 [Candidatus Saccharimonadales bacterium]|nr:hypothetical protein [Candidatus Saccharimonadales bacterium]